MRPAARRSVVVVAMATASCLVTGTAWPTTSAEAVRHFVVWSPHGLSSATGAALEDVAGVRDATPVILGLDWLMRSWTRDGTKVDRPPSGYGYPFEIAVVRPGAYGHFVAAEHRGAIRALRPGEVLISKTEAKLRGAGEGLRLGLRSGRMDVAGVLPDAALQGYEAITVRAPQGWDHQVRFYLVRADPDVSKDAMRAAVREAEGDIPFEIVGRAAKHLRYAPDTPPQTKHKRVFGEFPARPSSSGSFSILGKWVGRHITTDSVPILGRITCHRKLFPMLRGALEEIRSKGLSHTIRPSEYAGCYNSRFVATPPGVRLSRHSWGIALDINTSNNQFGSEPHQDPRMVKIMRSWGFLWGGRWPIPDGMHFEWKRFP